MTKYGLGVEKILRSEKQFQVISMSSSISLSNIANTNIAINIL